MAHTGTATVALSPLGLAGTAVYTPHAVVGTATIALSPIAFTSAAHATGGRHYGIMSGTLGRSRIVTAADSGTLTDVNIPLAQAIDCAEFDSIFVSVEFVGGSGPTLTVEPLVRDEAAVDGLRWKRLLLGARPGITLVASPAAADTGAMNGTGCVELRTFGMSPIFLRASAISGSPTNATILVVGGLKRPR